MRTRKSALPYLLLNIIVSAVTTLAVLVIWNLFQPRPPATPVLPTTLSASPTQTQVILSDCPPELSTPPDPGQPVIEISMVIGAGDLNTEEIDLSRIGPGELCMTHWQLQDEDGNTFTFPNLILNKDGKVTINTRTGHNSINELFWGLEKPVWSVGETVRLIDSQGNTQASYTIQ